MENIKFRAWDKKLESMAKVVSLSFYEEDSPFYGNETEAFLHYDKLDTTRLRSFKDIELMQCTGLKDNNGEDVYIGDCFKDCDGNIHIVTFKNGAFGCDNKLLINYHTQESIITHEPLVNYVYDGIEVIGNIYENRELSYI